MSCIKISEAESLDINLIDSFTASELEASALPVGSDEGRVQTEKVITITKKDGTSFHLSGEYAEAALMALRLHGF